jgi:hypothetical protein
MSSCGCFSVSMFERMSAAAKEKVRKACHVILPLLNSGARLHANRFQKVLACGLVLTCAAD